MHTLAPMEQNNNRQTQELSVKYLEQVAEVLKMLAHPHRLRIIELLEAAGEAPVHVLINQLGLSQPVTSSHLRKMKQLGLVAAVRNGREVNYHVADRRALSILNCIRSTRSNDL